MWFFSVGIEEVDDDSDSACIDVATSLLCCGMIRKCGRKNKTRSEKFKSEEKVESGRKKERKGMEKQVGWEENKKYVHFMLCSGL